MVEGRCSISQESISRSWASRTAAGLHRVVRAPQRCSCTRAPKIWRGEVPAALLAMCPIAAFWTAVYRDGQGAVVAQWGGPVGAAAAGAVARVVVAEPLSPATPPNFLAATGHYGSNPHSCSGTCVVWATIRTTNEPVPPSQRSDRGADISAH